MLKLTGEMLKIDLSILQYYPGVQQRHTIIIFLIVSDVIESEKIAAAAAEIAFDRGAKIIVLPAVPYGVNTGQTDIKLDMNINPSTQQAILNDIIEVLYRQNIFKLLIVNGHGGK